MLEGKKFPSFFMGEIMIKEERIYHVACDSCGKIIEDDFSFWKFGSNDTITIQYIDKQGKHSVNLYEGLDFCSVKCVGSYFTNICKDLAK